MNLLKDLQIYGLNNKEALVYASLMKKMEASVYSIAQDTKIPRSTTYEVLSSLKEKGLISIIRKNGVKYYVAESPKRLLKRLEEKTAAATSAIPVLMALSKSTSVSPNVKLYIGESGKKDVLDDILDTCESNKVNIYYAIAGLKLPKEVPKYLDRWIKRKEALGIRNQLIASDDGSHNIPQIYPNNKWRETRLLSKDFVFDTTINIYHNKVAIFSEINGIDHSIIIESPSISDTLKKFFTFMWEHAEKQGS